MKPLFTCESTKYYVVPVLAQCKDTLDTAQTLQPDILCGFCYDGYMARCRKNNLLLANVNSSIVANVKT